MSDDNNATQEWTFQPIGYLESCYKDKFAVPRQAGLVPAATARLRIRPELHPQDALQGLQDFSHLWLITVFHRNRQSRAAAKVHPPRLGGEALGVFATRSPHRPNPIGLSLVELVRIEKDCLWLRGIDLMEGTPVLDVKPYLPEVESRPEARGGWTQDRALASRLEISFSPEAEEDLEKFQARHPHEQLRALITQSLVLDPRPLLYRDEDRPVEEQRKPRHAFRLLDGDVHFRMLGPGKAEVFKILHLHGEFRPTHLR